MKIKHLTVLLMAAIVALAGWSCDKEPTPTPVEKPTIGIMEPEFDAEAMEVSVMIAPSTDATAWYWMVKGGLFHTDDAPAPNREEGATAKEITFAVEYGVEYTITAFAENKAGKSDIAEKKFCAMPEGEVTLTIGEITLNEETEMAKVTIYPSKATEAWYWQSYATDEDNSTLDWNIEEGNAEKVITFPYEWGKTIELRAYAQCGGVVSDIITAQCYFEPSVPTITVSKPSFDEATMTLSFEVTPSEDTHHWYWGIKTDSNSPSDYEYHEGAEAESVSCTVEYDKSYTFLFRAENVILQGQEKEAEFAVMSPCVEIAIENLTAYSLDAAITKGDHCVRYVVGAVHTDAYDRNIFIEQAQSSLNPDEDYPFAVFNSATESATFSEQNLVRNSLITSDENAGLMLVPGTSYTIAVYGENAEGMNSVVTKEFVVPSATLNGNVDVTIEMSDITENSATANVTAAQECKIIIGYMDPTVTKADIDNPFDFEGKSDEEIKAYIIGMTHAIPEIYSEPIARVLSDRLAIGATYYAYAVAIKDGKIGSVAFEKFTTKTPSLTGVAKITAAEIVEQTSHESLTVKLTADSQATKVRLYAAPATDHSAYAANLEYIMDANDYQNYREEYEIVDGVATAVVDVYHPGSNYYMYAVAVDGNGKAGEMVCVATLAGLETEYYTTIEEIIEESKISFDGTGTVDMVVTIIRQVDDRISATISTDTRSANAEKVWLIRFNGTIAEIEENVKYAFTNYPDGKILGSYKEAKVGYPLKYEDGGSDWDPKYEALQEYDSTWGGDILVAVVLDSSGKLNIDSYYAAGGAVKEY